MLAVTKPALIFLLAHVVFVGIAAMLYFIE
jgi:hypothetical protein